MTKIVNDIFKHYLSFKVNNLDFYFVVFFL